MIASGIMIVTGGSRGIGAATVRAAGLAGYDVCVNYRSGAAQAHALVEELQAMGRRAIAVYADMANEADIMQLFEATDRALGPLSVLVNNAGGVPSGRHRVDSILADELDQVLRLNLGLTRSGEADVYCSWRVWWVNCQCVVRLGSAGCAQSMDGLCGGQGWRGYLYQGASHRDCRRGHTRQWRETGPDRHRYARSNRDA